MQHHSPASVAATAGVSVALRICPKKIGHPCHSNIRQITTFVLVHELAFGPGLFTPPVFIPFSVLFIICVLHNQNSLMIWEKRSSRQILPGDSVCPSSPSSEPSFSLPSVSEQKNGFSSMYSTCPMISHEQKPYRLDSVIMRPAITICQGTSAPRARYRPRKSLRHHSCRHHICPPINKQERAVALLVSNCKTSIATTRYPNCFPSYWGRRQGA